MEIFFKKLLTNANLGDIVCIYRYTQLFTPQGDDDINIILNTASDKPMYEQIKNAVRQDILDGKLTDGTMLPSVRQLAAQLNVSAITTKRAYSDLEHEGLIYTSPGKGTFVKAPDKSVILEQFRERQLSEFDDCAKKLLTDGFTKDELIQRINTL